MLRAAALKCTVEEVDGRIIVTAPDGKWFVSNGHPTLCEVFSDEVDRQYAWNAAMSRMDGGLQDAVTAASACSEDIAKLVGGIPERTADEESQPQPQDVTPVLIDDSGSDESNADEPDDKG